MLTRAITVVWILVIAVIAIPLLESSEVPDIWRYSYVRLALIVVVALVLLYLYFVAVVFCFRNDIANSAIYPRVERIGGRKISRLSHRQRTFGRRGTRNIRLSGPSGTICPVRGRFDQVGCSLF